ncbi:retrovirus-related pol polyprotein from transposon TNT 1-94 [Tanacetum coccineum]
MATEVPQTLEYRGGQLNVAPMLEVENFTNWKKRFMCHIIGIEPQFKNIIENGPFVPMTARNRKLEGQLTGDESKAVNLDQRLKSLIMYVLPDDQMNSVINCETAKSIWEDLIPYHEDPSDMKDFQESPDDEEDTRSSQDYLNDLEKEFQEKALLAKSKRFFKKGSQRFSGAKGTNDTQCNKFKAKLALLSSSASSSKSSMVKNKGLVADTYEWDEEDVSSEDNEKTEVKVLMALADDENVVVGKESARNGKRVKIIMKKVHTLLDMEDNYERKPFIDYLCIDLNYVEEQRNNLVLKHRDLVQELNTRKEHLLVLKQSKLDFLTMHHVNTEILKENQNLRKELKELTTITEYGLTVLSNFGQKDLEFVKSSAEDTKVSIPGVERPWLSEAEGFTLPNHDTSRILPAESQVKITDPLVAITDTLTTEYDLADESLVCSTPLPPLENLVGVEPISGPKTIKSILKSNSTFKAEILKGVTINKPSSAPAKGNKNVSASKINPAPTGKLKNVKSEDDIPLSISDIRKPIWYLDSRCSRHLTGVKSYMYKYVEQLGPKVVFGDDSTCITEGYGSIKCNGIFDEKRGTIFKSNKEIVMIAPRVRDVYVLDMTSSAQESCFFAKVTENRNWFWHKRLAHLNFKAINQLEKQNLVIGLPSLVYSKDKPCLSCEKGKHHRANSKTKQTSSIKKYLHLLHMDLFGPVTPRFINHEKYTLVIINEYSRRILNIDFLHVFGCPVFIHNHKNHLGKFDEKADDGFFLGYSLVSKAFRVFNTRRQQTKETYHITFDERSKAIKFLKTLVDNLTIAESERYPPDKYLHHYEPSQRFQVNRNVASLIEPYEKPKPVVIEIDGSSDQNGQADQNALTDQNDQIDQNDLNDQNDHPVQADEILTDDQPEHLNHNNDNHIIDNLPNTEDV